MNKTIKKTYSLIYTLAILLAFTFNVVSVTATPTSGSLTINKFDVNRYENLKDSTGQASDQNNLPTTAEKMANVEFKVEKLLVTAEVTSVTSATPIDTTFTARIKQTDQDGIAVFNNLPLGYYLVTETIPAGYSSPENGQFIIAIPITNQDENGTLTTTYDVAVFPKNHKITPPVIDDIILPPKDDTPPSDEDIKPIKEPTTTIAPTTTITPSGTGHQTNPGGNPGSNSPSYRGKSVITGDSNQFLAYALLIIASTGIIIMVIKSKKHQTDKPNR